MIWLKKHRAGRDCAGRAVSFLLDASRLARATFAAMLFSKSYFFAYFWFSHRPADGEASA